MITILIQIDEEKNRGMVTYESSKASTAVFIDSDSVLDVLSAVHDAIRPAEVVHASSH